MNYIDTVKRCMLQYPGQNPTVVAFDHKAFFGGGAGFHWDGAGELVDIYCDVSISFDDVIAAKYAELNADIEEWETKDPRTLLMFLRKKHDYDFMVANVEQIIQYEIPDFDGFQPLFFCEHAPIFHVPGHVTTDWLQAAYRHAKAFGTALTTCTFHDKSDKDGYFKHIGALVDSLDEMMVARGLLATQEQRKVNGEIMSKMWAEGVAYLLRD